MKIVYKCSVRKRKGKRPFERRRCRWEDNIMVALKEVGCVMDSSAWGADPVSYPVVTSIFFPPG